MTRLFLAGLLTLACSGAGAQDAATTPTAGDAARVVPPDELSGRATGSASGRPDWALQLPKEQKVVFRGVVSFDSAGSGPGTVLYPAVGGAAGFFAALLAHGIVNESIKSGQKSKLEQEADKVLLPYQEVLGGLTHRDVMQRALRLAASGKTKQLIEPGSDTRADWIIQSAPVFSMTQDQSALIVDHAVSIRKHGSTTPFFENVIRVVSHASTEQDLAGYWTADQGERLKSLSAELLAQSLDVALDEAIKPGGSVSGPQRTIRYLEGLSEKIERAELLGRHCDRVLVRTLRGWLLSVPTKSSTGQAGAEKCREPQTSAK